MSVEVRAFTSAAESLARTEQTLVARLRYHNTFDWADLAFGTSIRIDPWNADRNRLDADDIALLGSAGALDIAVGFREVFWGVLESRHLVDVINQRDSDGRWPRHEKLGQSMIGVSWTPTWGAVDFYLLPWARPRPFDGRRGRLWSNAEVDASARRYSSASLRHLAWATRWSVSAAAWDLGVSYFGGTVRDPRFEVADATVDPYRLAPIYDRVHQVGVDAQYTGSSWLWKLELVTVDPGNRRYIALGSGVEYAHADYLSVFAEFLFDGRDREATSSLEHDVFLGSRILFQDGSVFGGASVDVTSGNVIGSFEVLRRFGNDIALTLALRVFAGHEVHEPRFALREETTVSLLLRRHF